MQTSPWHNFSATGTLSAMWSGDDERGRVERSYLRYAGVGVQYGLTILFMTLLGIWLDKRFGTAPLLLLVCLLVGFVGATFSLIHTVLGSDKPGRKP
jgi:F0F1-type ATP synthase assembly protein I